MLLLAVVQVTASEINCNGNVTIRNGEDAKNVRENCKAIAGNLDLDIFETCNLDGLEEVQGDVVHQCLTKQKGLDYCMDASTTFTISSSTLRSINGSLRFSIIGESKNWISLNSTRSARRSAYTHLTTLHTSIFPT